MNQSSSNGGNRSGGGDQKSSSCLRKCTVFVLLAALVGAGGILVWQLLPEDSKTQIQSIFNQTGSDLDSNGQGELAGGNDSGDGTSPAAFAFNRCAANATACCNGVESICDSPISDVMFATVHNAMSSSEDGFFIAANNEFSLESSLEAGYRGINIDIGKCNGDYKLIHTSCLLGQRDPVEVFTNINTFLDDNPTEVLIVTLQIAEDTADLQEIYAIMQGVDGWVDRMYVHNPDAATWPTMQDLITANQRIVFFHFNGPRCSQVTCPPGFHDWFTYAVEAEFSFNSVEEVQDVAYACAAGRGNGGRRDFFGINAFLSLPSERAAEQLNAKSFLNGYIDDCTNFNDGLDVNLVFVDFWNQGDLVEVVQLRNEALGKSRRTRLRLH
jgi:hypothetical protein